MSKIVALIFVALLAQCIPDDDQRKDASGAVDADVSATDAGERVQCSPRTNVNNRYGNAGWSNSDSGLAISLVSFFVLVIFAVVLSRRVSKAPEQIQTIVKRLTDVATQIEAGARSALPPGFRVDYVEPAVGVVGTGTTGVYIRGEGFPEQVEVSFGLTKVSAVEVLSSKCLRVVAPAGSKEEVVNVSVKKKLSGESCALPGAFRYELPAWT